MSGSSPLFVLLDSNSQVIQLESVLASALAATPDPVCGSRTHRRTLRSVAGYTRGRRPGVQLRVRAVAAGPADTHPDDRALEPRFALIRILAKLVEHRDSNQALASIRHAAMRYS